MDIESLNSINVVASAVIGGVFVFYKYWNSKRDSRAKTRLKMLELALPELDNIITELETQSCNINESRISKSRVILIEERLSQAYCLPLSIEEILVLAKSKRPTFSFQGYAKYSMFLSINSSCISRRPDLVKKAYKIPYLNKSIHLPPITYTILLLMAIVAGALPVFFAFYVLPDQLAEATTGISVYIALLVLIIPLIGFTFLALLFLHLLVRNPTESQLVRMFDNIYQPTEENQAN